MIDLDYTSEKKLECVFYKEQVMVEIGIAEYFSMGGALGIIGSLFVVLYFSRKQMQALSAHIETKILNVWMKECVKLLRLE